MNRLETFDGRKARILIVDDERQNRQVLEVMLLAEEYEIDNADCGEQALRRIAASPPDLVLLDVMMPGMNGYEVAASIKKGIATRKIPIIMVTALDDPEAKMLGLNAGVEDFLTKPIHRAELCVRVRNLLRLKAYGDDHDHHTEALEEEVTARVVEMVKQTETMMGQTAALAEQAALLDLAPDAIIVLDMQLAITFWNAGAERMYGWSRQEVLGSPKDEVLRTVYSEPREEFEATLLRQGWWAGEEIHHTRAGASLSVASRAALQRDPAGLPVRILSISNDVSGRKALEAKLRQANKMEAVGRLAGGVAHDFNNLLTAILGYSEIVTETLDKKDSRRADMDEIIKAGRRGADLTNQLLAFSRQQVLQPTVLDLNELVTDMQPMLSRLIGARVEFVPCLAADLGAVKADSAQLEQVIMNLVINARDAMPDGGRVSIVTANVELDDSFQHDFAVRPGPYVMMTVGDTGNGMDEATKLRLFEPFFTTKELGKGTGLGLATVYGIVEQSGGYIWVYSELGEGTVFKVYLPFVERGDAAIVKSAKEAPLATGTEAVLIVEDEEPVRLLMGSILRSAGYRVIEARDAEEAEALFQLHSATITLLVTDVIMPGLTGPKLYERLALQRPDLKVLYVSGYTDDMIARQSARFDFLQKPFSANSLHRKVREVLDT